uniref:Acyl carrier protein n=1 Tax=Gracilaria salicornia TaxID=172968 RepID=W8DXE6_9FLOR|nr:acyl carrier protein [Gracilaria salicornia]AHH24593.1 acyl carrier protein [Gracilaria salicornia]UAD87635.1 acyl carrier protein [Gracilaria salicornia]
MSSPQSTLSVFERVQNVVVEQLNVNAQQVTQDVKFSELGADSLDTVELVMALEEEFSIEIPDKDAENIEKFDQAVEFIENKINSTKTDKVDKN